jgi:hypothetical protein
VGVKMAFTAWNFYIKYITIIKFGFSKPKPKFCPACVDDRDPRQTATTI